MLPKTLTKNSSLFEGDLIHQGSGGSKILVCPFVKEVLVEKEQEPSEECVFTKIGGQENLAKFMTIFREKLEAEDNELPPEKIKVILNDFKGGLEFLILIEYIFKDFKIDYGLVK